MVKTIDFYIGKNSYAEFENQKFELGHVNNINFLCNRKEVKVFYKSGEEFKKAPEDVESFIKKIENINEVFPEKSYIAYNGVYSKYLEDVGFSFILSDEKKCNINYLIE